LYKECAKIKKKKFRRQKFNLLAVISNPEMVASDSSKKKTMFKICAVSFETPSMQEAIHIGYFAMQQFRYRVRAGSSLLL